MTQVTNTNAEMPCVEATDESSTVVAREGPVTPSGAPRRKRIKKEKL